MMASKEGDVAVQILQQVVADEHENKNDSCLFYDPPMQPYFFMLSDSLQLSLLSFLLQANLYTKFWNIV